MNSEFSAEHAVVTGAGRGIGAAIARALAASGARLTLFGRGREALESLAAALASEYPEAPAAAIAAVDVTESGALAGAFDRARQQTGPITILVNNAGQAASAPLKATDEALWQRMIDVNLTSVYRCTRAVLPDMIARNHGRIVNIASTAGLTGYPYVTAYCAAKHGVIGLTRALARELARTSLTVNAVCPGYTDTDLVRGAVANIRAKTGKSEAETIESLTAANPQRRLVTPKEVANAVLWLCSAGASSITGQSISVAGGELM